MSPDVTFTFSVKVAKLGVNPCVVVPARISRAINVRGFVPVAGTLNDAPFHANLVPIGGLRRRRLNTDMRVRASVAVGDRVKISMTIDRRPRPLRVPSALSAALDANPSARAQWDALPPSRRKEILAYLNALKQSATVERNVARVVEKLGSGADGGPWRGR